MLKSKHKLWRTNFRKSALYAFIALIISISISLFGIITYTSESAKDNSRRTFESSLWSALQLQLQTYRLLDYLINLDVNAFPLKGEAFFEYDLLMSRIDLLREGDIGSLIRHFEEGRIVKHLNLISGELELLSFNIAKLEEGDESYLPSLIGRIQRLQPQIDEFVALVNKGSTAYIDTDHQAFKQNLSTIQLLSMSLLICLLLLSFFAVRALLALQKSLKDNHHLKTGMQTVHDDKASMMAFIHQELRAPIHAILSTARIAQNTSSPQDSMDYPKHIQETGEQLLQNLAMFSDLAHIEANKLHLFHTTGNLQSHIESYLTQFEPQMTRKGLQSIAYIDPSLPKEITIDFNRLKEMIICLLQNALTHTTSGSISIQIRPSILAVPLLTRPLESDKEASMLQIAIKDTGQGMPKRLQDNLRMIPLLPQNNESILKKVGLNLALCHKLVKLMNGEVHFYNSPKEGCEFWVDVPYYIEQTNKKNRHNTQLQSSKKRALVLEEDTHLADVLSNLLVSLNVTPVVFEDGQSLSADKFDVIILGHSIGLKENGLERIKSLKKQGVPILSYCANQIEQDTISIVPLFFPLLPSQLEKIMAQIFN